VNGWIKKVLGVPRRQHPYLTGILVILFNMHDVDRSISGHWQVLGQTDCLSRVARDDLEHCGHCCASFVFASTKYGCRSRTR
jgi:hypothetical protein